MRTLKESILDKDFDISESDEIRMFVDQIFNLVKWEYWNGYLARIISPSSYQIFDKILNIIQALIKTYKNSQSAKAEILHDKKHSIIHIIEKARRYEGVEGIKISVPKSFQRDTVKIYYSATFDYDSVVSEKGLKKIGIVPLDVILAIKEKIQFESST